MPVNVGDARFAFKSRAVCCAVETGLLASLVLSTFPRPTSPLTIPVGVLITGDVSVLFVRVAVAARSVELDVLSTLPSPTSPLTKPVGAVIDAPVGIVTVPVNVGEASGAFSPNAVVMPAAYDASSPMASANSLRVFNAPGAPPIKSVTAPVTKAVVAI